MPPTARTKTPRSTTKTRFPWALLLALLGSAYLFWGLPSQLDNRKVQVEFSKEPIQP